MIFRPEASPFPRWFGPYSIARGNDSGFRVRGGLLGASVVSEDGQEFWTAKETQGVANLVKLVRAHWQGGRVLLLPNGFVIKPLPNEGARVLVGRANETLVLTSESGAVLDFSNICQLTAGTVWPGPGTIGLECVISPDGSLTSRWSRSTRYGQEETHERITEPNPSLSEGFRRTRPGDISGRVRVTVGGHVITTCHLTNGGFRSHYVGRILPTNFYDWNRWIEER